MTKQDFLKELEDLLLDIPLEERMEALAYYETYFEDAGWEHEDEIIKELESPVKVAASIKALLNANEQDIKNRGYFTEKGYEDDGLKGPKLELSRDNTERQQTYSRSSTADDKQSDSVNEGSYDRTNYQKNNAASRVIVIILLCIFAIPVGIPVVATIFSFILAAVITVGALWLAFAILSVVLIITGIILTIVGVIKVIGLPAVGFFMTGSGIFVLGIGILFSLATIGLSTKVFPVLYQWIVDLCKLPLKGRRVSA
ncbi:hypothetical protein acsn021_23030 [Anaerocolumna cellulosilytica]|uniref:Uncharacterized protein n=1 Tax=Anaerocolumna cellulosilytica TaxID=433286 RepID=A0A6S6QVW2_9FIRM|nr:DUF1700 domain-containing protein [Anaerocolumna cellulosilytica]MBB5194052.1 putative membrane protein [Anaerocolumna cellulosilytica]BCJ94734.1 hypothetical protein acsn021_23030 [Anaerocolumna cellulosilytica]